MRTGRLSTGLSRVPPELPPEPRLGPLPPPPLPMEPGPLFPNTLPLPLPELPEPLVLPPPPRTEPTTPPRAPPPLPELRLKPLLLPEPLPPPVPEVTVLRLPTAASSDPTTPPTSTAVPSLTCATGTIASWLDAPSETLSVAAASSWPPRPFTVWLRSPLRATSRAVARARAPWR